MFDYKSFAALLHSASMCGATIRRNTIRRKTIWRNNNSAQIRRKNKKILIFYSNLLKYKIKRKKSFKEKCKILFQNLQINILGTCKIILLQFNLMAYQTQQRCLIAPCCTLEVHQQGIRSA